MTRSALIIHGYSSRNRGDGLLVEESLALIREALGEDTDVTLLASDPESFDHLGLTVHRTRPSARGWSRDYLRTLTRFGRYDLVVGVGGGYLRTGTLTESAKTVLVHGPQLVAAAVTSTPTVYLPQSIGPLRGGSRYPALPLLRRLSTVMLRDDRSVGELRLPGAVRTSDLAISSPGFTERFAGDRPAPAVSTTGTVLTVRKVHGEVPAGVVALADALRAADVPLVGYVQSAVGGNNDAEAQRSVTPEPLIDEDAYLRRGDHGTDAPRVVVAVRLHAALLALRAGHRVIHLSYERKGFSAFADLGLSEWVHNVNAVDPAVVTAQVLALRDDPAEQARYDDAVRSRIPDLRDRHGRVVSALRDAAGAPEPGTAQVVQP